MPEKNISPEQVIQALHLQPLAQEGGLFSESYRSPEMIPSTALPDRYPLGDKPFGTAIFYLLTGDPGSFSALHRLPSDEIWHFYLGDPLEITLLYPDGSSQQVTLGQDILNGQKVQFIVPRGTWQGTRVAKGGHFALVGTTMAPGYTPEDYEDGARTTLLEMYPQEREKILLLTR